MFGRKKKEQNIAQEKLADYAFNSLLKEGEHYTVAARINGATLVKKTVRWAYFSAVGENIQACFSIETDKGLFCFQAREQELKLVNTEACTAFYPQLKP